MTDAPEWNRVKDLLYTALGLPSDERDAFLVRSCRGDSSLRAELESLLAAHAAAADFGERHSSIQAGHRIGPYEIQSRIGSGGMGDVYRARDARLARDV